MAKKKNVEPEKSNGNEEELEEFEPIEEDSEDLGLEEDDEIFSERGFKGLDEGRPEGNAARDPKPAVKKPVAKPAVKGPAEQKAASAPGLPAASLKKGPADKLPDVGVMTGLREQLLAVHATLDREKHPKIDRATQHVQQALTWLNDFLRS